jgi:putative thioredoxin
MASQQIVFDVPPGQFDGRVVAASSKVPIVVDFWAEWCTPCRTLEPILERVVASYQGRALLAKVNVDKDPQTAVLYGVQSIPAVKVFRGGRIVGEFMGALPESEVTRILAAVLPSRTDEFVNEGDRLVETGHIEEAEKSFRKALEENPEHTGALLRLGTMAAEGGDAAQARKLLSRIEENAAEYDAAQGVLARIEFGDRCRQKGGRAACEQKLARKADDAEARYDLACCLAAEGDHGRALEEFLKVVSSDRNLRDQARNAMVRIFSLLGPGSELAAAYRRKLASALY